MKSKVRFKGKLRSYLCWPLWLTIPMTLADVGLYFYDVTAGFLLTVFIAIYFVLELGLYYNTDRGLQMRLSILPHSMQRYRKNF
jgi:hypothetical protein